MVLGITYAFIFSFCSLIFACLNESAHLYLCKMEKMYKLWKRDVWLMSMLRYGELLGWWNEESSEIDAPHLGSIDMEKANVP